MIIGVPKEILEGERRVAVTPVGVQALCAEGHRVLVEAEAGLASGFNDEDYHRVGAKVVASAPEAWRGAELIIKVKGPLREEHPFFREGLLIFAFLHLAASKELTDALLNSGVIGIAFETVENEDRSRPILSPMSRIAGRLAVQEGACLLCAHKGGKGLLMGGMAGVRPARVVILGAGASGMAACRLAVGMGAAVALLDIDLGRLSYLEELVHGNLVTLYASPARVEEEVEKADLAIGAVYLSGARAPKVVSRRLVEMMEPGSVIVDLAVDQGGCFETTRPTSPINPTYVEHGVIHYAVINMPAMVPRTATHSLADAVLPYALKLASLGYERAARADPAIMKGLNTARGEILHPGLASSFGLPCAKL